MCEVQEIEVTTYEDKVNTYKDNFKTYLYEDKEYDEGKINNPDEESTAVGTCIQNKEPTFFDCDSDNGDFEMKGLRGYLDDLGMFGSVLTEHLTRAQMNLGMADEELAASLQAAIGWSLELYSHGGILASKLATSVPKFDFNLLPDRILGGDPDPDKILCDAESRLRDLRLEIRDVRSSYLALMDHIRYFGDVAEVSLAGFQMQQAFAAEASMTLGLYHLQAAQEHIEELSPFWMVLHSSELELGRMEEGVQCLALSACPGGLVD